MQINGIVHTVGAPVARGQNGFMVRDVILDITDANSQYHNYCSVQFCGKNVELADTLVPGMHVEVCFSINGFLNEKGTVFNNLRAFKVTPWGVGSSHVTRQPTPQPTYTPPAQPYAPPAQPYAPQPTPQPMVQPTYHQPIQQPNYQQQAPPTNDGLPF